MEKLHNYEGMSGRLERLKENMKEKIANFKENHPENIFELVKIAADNHLKGNVRADEDFSHLYRKKDRFELIRISAAVMGIEFSYAAETAFVSPTLLKIGVEHQKMTLVWALSPLVGFFICPLLGSLSDRCKLNLGRRRPFIVLLSIGIVLGLLLLPNGEDLGYIFGDIKTNTSIAELRTPNASNKESHPWGIFFTVVGTVLLDFSADACQSPSRAYLLDVCVPDDHTKGLSTFTIMAGLGGFMGYSMGAFDWDVTVIGRSLGGHVKAVFTIITFIYILCVTMTLSSFKEIPLWLLEQNKNKTQNTGEGQIDYGTLRSSSISSVKNDETTQNTKSGNLQDETSFIDENADLSDSQCDYKNHDQHHSNYLKDDEHNIDETTTTTSLRQYLLSIIYMPYSLKVVCLTNLFCWMAHVCYSLYFTDFVGESVFNGDPKASLGTVPQKKYEEGVRFGCWGMAMYSLSCACYSLVIEKLIQNFKAKPVYVGGLLFYSFGMTFMALTKSKASVILFSWTAGVMYSTLFTMPYLLVAHYHAVDVFEFDAHASSKLTSVRGLGTDVAIVSSMVFLAQFILSIFMGTIISISGTTTAVVGTASFLSLCGAISASKIMYLDL